MSTSGSRRSRRTTSLIWSALIGADRVLFGSDWPHPEGFHEPKAFLSEIADLPDDDQRQILGDNLFGLLGIPAVASCGP